MQGYCKILLVNLAPPARYRRLAQDPCSPTDLPTPSIDTPAEIFNDPPDPVLRFPPAFPVPKASAFLFLSYPLSEPQVLSYTRTAPHPQAAVSTTHVVYGQRDCSGRLDHRVAGDSLLSLTASSAMADCSQTRDLVQPLVITPGRELNSKYGVYRHADLIGVPYGSKIGSRNGKGFIHVLRPTPELWTLALPHRTQILYLADIAFVCSWLNIKPGSRVIEAGMFVVHYVIRDGSTAVSRLT